MKQSARRCFVDREVVAQRSENVVNETTLVVDVPRIIHRNPRHTISFREIDQRRGKRGFTSAGVMELNFDSETLAKYFTPFA
jgi:hypothetical protein